MDEFQETLQRWLAAIEFGNQPQGVTAGGFCECIQGATAMKSGVMIVSGTSEITSEKMQRALSAVYRRIHCNAELTWMNERDVRLYFRNFLLKFLDGATPTDWDSWEDEFVRDSPWINSRPITIDMMKQFLMSRITESSVRGIGKFASGTLKNFHVPSERRNEFLDLIFDSQSAISFLDAYAPVVQIAVTQSSTP